MGHMVSAVGVEVDSEKTKAMAEYPVPVNLKTIQRFLDMAGWYHRFVPNFSELAEPLNALKRKGVKFKWTFECQAAFEALKQHLMSPPILGHPCFDFRFVVYTDASDVGLGAVLVQQTGLGTEEVLAYASRTLNKAKRNYAMTEKECLAVVWALERWRYYLEENDLSPSGDRSFFSGMGPQNPEAKHTSDQVGSEAAGVHFQEFTFTVQYRTVFYQPALSQLTRHF